MKELLIGIGCSALTVLMLALFVAISHRRIVEEIKQENGEMLAEVLTAVFNQDRIKEKCAEKAKEGETAIDLYEVM
jgi:Na+-translocating ferredoxin:NAD+ oxidoreductase RnfG subunit